MNLPRLLAAAAVFFCAPAPAVAQVVDTKAGKVEFIGLESTTPEQALAPLIKEANGGRPHLCAASFLKAGFADASVRMVEPGGPVLWVVKLVEPAHKNRIHRRPAPTAQVALPSKWAALRAQMDAPSVGFQVAMNWFGKAREAADHAATLKAAAAVFGDELPYEPAEVEAAWTLVRSFREPSDKELAIWVIRHDSDPGNRAAAACILANFPDSDFVYWELADALLDEHSLVNDFAQKSLRALVAASPRTVDWTPAASGLRRLLDGTNLFAFETMADVLRETRIAPELAPKLLGGKDGGAMLVASARAVEPSTRSRARSLLIQLRGKDLGDDWAAWRAWMQSL